MASLPSSIVNRITELGVVGKLAKGALNPTVHVANTDDKQRPLRNATQHWSPLWHRAIDRNSFSATIQSTPYPQSGPFVKSMSPQFRNKIFIKNYSDLLYLVHYC